MQSNLPRMIYIPILIVIFKIAYLIMPRDGTYDRFVLHVDLQAQ